MFATCCLTMLVTGLGCGFGCNSQINYFLSSCVLFSSDGIRRAFRTLLVFYAGKLFSVLTLCLMTSLLGRCVLLDYFAEYVNAVSIIVNLSFIAVGIFSIIRVIQAKKHKCSCDRSPDKSRFYTLTPVLVGAVYGITPCAPFLMLIGYAVGLDPVQSIVLGIIFTLANAVSPVLLLVAMMGVVSKKMYLSIPSLVLCVKVIVSTALILIGSIRIYVLIASP